MLLQHSDALKKLQDPDNGSSWDHTLSRGIAAKSQTIHYYNSSIKDKAKR